MGLDVDRHACRRSTGTPLFAHEHAVAGRGRGLALVVARTRAPGAGCLAEPSVRLSFLLVLAPHCSSDLYMRLVKLMWSRL